MTPQVQAAGVRADSAGSPPIVVVSISSSSLSESAPDLLVSNTTGVPDVGPYHDATSSNTTSRLTRDGVKTLITLLLK